MFDIAFSELVVIAIVALIVVGPEKLPKLARTAGLLISRVRNYANSIKEEIENTVKLEELRKVSVDAENNLKALNQQLQIQPNKDTDKGKEFLPAEEAKSKKLAESILDNNF
jgi:sec-independent protein translocase protein TatB